MSSSSQLRGIRRARPALPLAGLLLVGLLLTGCAKSNYPYHWGIVFDSVFRPDALIINGVWLTLSISVVSQIIGVVLGVLGAIGKISRLGPMRWIASVYVWFFRGTPLLVQITFIYFGLGVARIYQWPDLNILGLGVPGAVQAGIVALGVNEGAYMTEIVRAGILAIDPGQMEAAKSLGMTYSKAMRRIVLPQAARVIVPPLGNEFNNMLKTTSLLVIISVPELYVTFSRKNSSGPTVFHTFELFIAAAIWYLLLTSIWGLIQARIERRLGRGTNAAVNAAPGMRERLFGRFSSPGGGMR
ncbi:MAG: amino acid ABC transporter permease [Chloroflexota bacterium]